MEPHARIGVIFFMVIVTSGIARGRVHTTAATAKFPKMVAILRPIG